MKQVIGSLYVLLWLMDCELGRHSGWRHLESWLSVMLEDRLTLIVYLDGWIGKTYQGSVISWHRLRILSVCKCSATRVPICSASYKAIYSNRQLSSYLFICHTYTPLVAVSILITYHACRGGRTIFILHPVCRGDRTNFILRHACRGNRTLLILCLFQPQFS